jgi:hypothetical protein
MVYEPGLAEETERPSPTMELTLATSGSVEASSDH